MSETVALERLGKFSQWALLSLVFFIPLLEAPKNLLAVVLLLASIFHLRQQNWSLHKLQQIFLLWIIVAALVSAHAALSYGFSTEGFRDLFRYCAVGFAVTSIASSIHSDRLLVFAAIAGSFVALVWALYGLYWGNVQGLQLKSVGHPNHSSIYLQYSLCIGLPYLFFGRCSGAFRLLLAAMLAAIAAGIVISQSRAAIAAMLIVLLLCVALAVWCRKWRTLIGVAVVAAIGLLVLGPHLDAIMAKHQFWLRELVINAASGLTPREQLNLISQLVVAEHTWFGIGYANYGDYMLHQLPILLQHQQQELGFEMYDFILGVHPHNVYFDHLTASGLVGFVVFCLFFAYLAFFLYQHRFWQIKTSTKQPQWWWITVLCLCFSILAIGLFNSSFRSENALLSVVFISYICSRYAASNGQQMSSTTPSASDHV